MTDFAHLHLHTEYSLLDGACRIDRVLEHAKSLGQTAMAVTDHGVMYGVIDFYKRAKQIGIKPVIGCEVYVAPRTMVDKVHRVDSSPHHLVLLCKNAAGYQNLISLVSKGSIEGFYSKPRIDLDLLAQKSEGLIALSACLSGQIPRLLVAGDYEGARAAAERHIEIFGRENYYIEVQNHGIEEQQRILPLLRRLAAELGLGMVATNDAHYITRADSRMQHVLTCIQTNTTVENPSLEFATDEFFVKSREEMAQALPGFEDALDNTLRIAERCNLDFEFGKLKLPTFTAPDGRDNREYFRARCAGGLRRHYGEHPDPEIAARLEHEISVIEKMGYVDYYLIVHDFIDFAKSRGIPVGPGRGSGAGSLAAYCIGITGVDPIRYGLIFERFLNPERISMPDFDIDFCYVRRPEVIEYVVGKYGADHVAQIITFGTMAARAALRDTGRALGMSYQQVDTIAKQVPMELGITLEKALGSSHDFKKLYDEDAAARDLIDMAKSIEGMPRHASTHAAGVVITKEPVERYVPLQGGEGAIVTQFPMGTLEELGLLKMDFLGLRNLTVIADSERMIRSQAPGFSIESIPLDDPEVYAMLSRGQTEGVFQFESAGMRQVLSQLGPEHMEDLIAVISLYRPGPMESIPRYIKNRHHPHLVTYRHPSLAAILDVTYGCIVYQEQVMQICRELAGFSYGRADLMRRAMSKKKADVMAKERDHFIYGLYRADGSVECPGCVANGIPEQVASDIFDEMSSFASYAFNKSHAAAYALVSYQTAWLKCHHPRQYMAALLTSVLDNTPKLVSYIGECERLGISILPPDVNLSREEFTAEDKGIRFGLLAIRNLGRQIVAHLVQRRDGQGPYESFYDFCSRLYDADLRRRTLESLIRSGALDGFGLTRKALIEGSEAVLEDAERKYKASSAGQLNLFDTMAPEHLPARHPEVPNCPEYEPSQLLKMEKDALGLYVSGHPLSAHRARIAQMGATPIADILAAAEQAENRAGHLHDDAPVTVAAVIEAKKLVVTKRGETMAYLSAADLTGSIEVLVFPKTLSQCAALTDVDTLVVLSGRLSFREDEDPKLRLEAIRPLLGDQPASAGSKRHPPGLYLKILPGREADWERAQKAMAVFEGGSVPVYAYFEARKKLAQAPPEKCLESANDPLLSELRRILGEKNVVLVPRQPSQSTLTGGAS